MSKTNFSDKCKIIGDLWLFYREDAKQNEAWSDFFDYNDISLPLSYMLANDYAILNEESDATSYIEETWDMLCEYIEVDAEGEYHSIQELFDASDRPALES